MTTSSKTETDSGPQAPTAEWIDKTVSDAFDEFLAAISAPRKLHKSEQHNRDSYLDREQPSSTKIYDIINSYHSFCRLCEQHFYSRSVVNDINSFFQKHANTAYHRQLRTVELPPDDEPIFTWEEKYFSGRCNICGISGLKTYVMDSGYKPNEIMKQHACVWDKENRDTNERVLRKLNLLKRYCELKIFQEKFIKTIQGSVVCLMCGVKLPWPPEKAACHLGSDIHYQKFCLFLRKCFNFALKDVLNGFNLEVVTRALVSRDPPPILNFFDVDDERKCLEQSNNRENPYPEEKGNFSFCPLDEQKAERTEETDFLHNDSCLLCGVAFEPGHVKSQPHQEKARNLSQNSFDSPSKYVIYFRNMSKRLHVARNMKRLEQGKEEPIGGRERKRNPPKPKPQPQPQELTSHTNYFKTLLREKLHLVKFIFTVTKTEIYCQVCDKRVRPAYEIIHLNGSSHKFHEARWEELRKNFENKKFVETFEKIRNVIVCLLCGVAITFTNFYDHLKGDMHKHRFEWYSGLDVSVPMSSALVFHKDFSCLCVICKTQLNKKASPPSLEVTLKNILFHWPCPKLNDRGADSEVIVDGDEKVEDSDRRKSVRDSSEPRGEANGTRNGEDGPSVDFKKVERTVESIVSVFEEKIMKNVMEKSASVIGQLEDLKLGAVEKEPDVKGEPPPPFDCDQPSTPPCVPEPPAVIENSSRREGKKWITRKTENETAIGEKESPAEEEEEEGEAEAEEYEGADEEGREEEEEEHEEEGKEEKERVEEGEEEEEDEHEVILIEGLTKNRRKPAFIYSKFASFGKIRYVFFEGKLTILAFANPGVAEEAIKGSDKFVKNHKVTLTISKRKLRPKPAKASLNESVRLLLANPQALMDFVLNLIMQAVAASESSIEKTREELVCSTIISAVFEAFPQGRCYPFGSRLSGLTLNNSDLDVFLDCGGMYEGFKNTSSSMERKLVNRVGGLLRKKLEVTDVIVVDRARVPIVSFLHKPTLMHCDLSFKNGLSIQNTLLIKFMTSLDWRVRPLILFLKHWAKLNGLHGPPNFSSYAIAMLVIYYLEQLETPVLPTIESLQSSYVGRRTTIGGWDCSINTNPLNIHKSENKDSFPQLLSGLFQFYGGFDYNSNVISPLTGKLLPRNAFSSSGKTGLPMCYKRHALNIPPPIESLVDNKIPICIIDPFDVSHVLTKGFTSRNLLNFTILCQQSHEQLQKGIIVVTADSPSIPE